MKNYVLKVEMMLLTWSTGLTPQQKLAIKQLLTPITILKAILIAIVETVGVIYLVKGGSEFFTAWQQADNTSMNLALKGLISGLGMCAIGVIIGIFGF